jgi:hypothetical protein
MNIIAYQVESYDKESGAWIKRAEFPVSQETVTTKFLWFKAEKQVYSRKAVIQARREAYAMADRPVFRSRHPRILEIVECRGELVAQIVWQGGNWTTGVR